MSNAKFFFILVLTCMSLASKSQTFQRNGDKVVRKGVAIEFSKVKVGDFKLDQGKGTDTVVHRAITIARPVKVNGAKVQVSGNEPQYKGEWIFHDYLFNGIADELNKIPDGSYTLNLRDILVGVKGKVDYFGYEGIRDSSGANALALDVQLAIFKRLCTVMDEANFIPANDNDHKGKSPAFVNDKDIWKAYFRVNNRSIYYSK